MKKLLLGLSIGFAVLILLPGSTLVAPLAAQQDEGVELDSIEDLVPCCDGPRVRGAAPEGFAIREVHEPGKVFADAESMARMAEEGRRRAPRGRRLDATPSAREFIEPLAPKLRSQFSALDIGDGGGWIPPDTTLAVGPEHVLQGVNVAFRLSTKANKNVDVMTGEAFFHTGDSLFDPKVHYDPLSGRFFLVILDLDENAGRSRVYMSVSRSATPQSLGPDDWCSYFFNAKKKGAWGDYPGIGTSGDWFTVSTNNFRLDNGNYSSAWLWVMDKARLVDNATSCPSNKVFAFRVNNDKDGTVAFTLQPAQHLDDSARAGGEHHVVASQPVGFSEQYAWLTVSANNGGKPKVSSRMVQAEGYAFPPDATQKGGSRELDTIGSRLMQQAVIVGGNLWLAHTSGCYVEDPNDVISCVRVARIPVGASATDFEDLFGMDGHFFWVPGIAVAGNGDVITAFQMSGQKYRLSTGMAGLRGGAARFGPLTAVEDEFFDAPKVAFKGKCPTELGNPIRTGDYMGVVADPVNDDVWISGEFGAKVSGTCAWDTKIGVVSY